MSVHGVVTIPAAELARLRSCEAVLRKIVKHEMTRWEMPVDLFDEAFELVKSNVDKCNQKLSPKTP